MNHEKAIRLIWDIENNFNVCELSHQGILIWPILRIIIYNSNIENNATTKKQKLSTIIKYSTFILFEKLLDKGNNTPIKQAKIYCSSHTTSRTSQLDGKWHDFIFSPLIEWLKQDNPTTSIFFEEFAPKGEYRTPRYEQSEYITTSLTIAKILGTLLPEKLDNSLVKRINEISDYIKSQQKNNSCLSEKNISIRLSQFIRLVKYYQNRLELITPSLVFMVTYYSLQCMALTHACHTLKIKTIDIQHGLQDIKHVAYGIWHNVNQNNYSCLPDFFMVWSEDERKNLQINKYKHQAIVCGNIQQAYWHNKSHPLQKKLSSIIEKSGRTIVILVSLQPIKNNLVDEILKTINENKFIDCFWLFRLHPSIKNEQEHAIKDKLASFNHCCEYQLSSSLPLPLVINIATGHVTLFSSVTLEAGAVGIPTLLYYDKENFFSELDRNKMIFKKKQNETFSECFHNYLFNIKNYQKIEYKNNNSTPIKEFFRQTNINI